MIYWLEVLLSTSQRCKNCVFRFEATMNSRTTNTYSMSPCNKIRFQRFLRKSLGMTGTIPGDENQPCQSQRMATVPASLSSSSSPASAPSLPEPWQKCWTSSSITENSCILMWPSKLQKTVCIYIYFSNSPRLKLYFNRSEHISKYININPISTCNNKFLNQVNLRSSLAWSNPSHWHGWKAWVVMAMSPRTIVDP